VSKPDDSAGMPGSALQAIGVIETPFLKPGGTPS